MASPLKTPGVYLDDGPDIPVHVVPVHVAPVPVVPVHVVPVHVAPVHGVPGVPVSHPA